MIWCPILTALSRVHLQLVELLLELEVRQLKVKQSPARTRWQSRKHATLAREHHVNTHRGITQTCGRKKQVLARDRGLLPARQPSAVNSEPERILRGCTLAVALLSRSLIPLRPIRSPDADSTRTSNHVSAGACFLV